MTSTTDERLLRLLGGAELSDLRARLRRRYELGPADGKLPSIQVGKLNETERAALASLVGRKGGVATSISIDIAEVDRVLSDAGIAPCLRAALERLDGPIVHRATELSRIRDSWASVLAGCTHKLAAPLSGRPVVASWDADLTAAMKKTGIKIEEEAIAQRLIELLGEEPLWV
jgi:hypothetical protein